MLKDSDILVGANLLGCEPEVIRAVIDVEAPRGAYDSTGRLTILFEAHIFWKELLKKNIDPRKQPPRYLGILTKSWGGVPYGKYSEQWGRLTLASEINKEAAYRSASYGAFQIMGNNAEDLGHTDVFEFVEFMKESELNQLLSFCKFVKFKKIDKYLQKKQWDKFALFYNGS